MSHVIVYWSRAKSSSAWSVQCYTETFKSSPVESDPIVGQILNHCVVSATYSYEYLYNGEKKKLRMNLK